jgi:hypothetical protein
VLPAHGIGQIVQLLKPGGPTLFEPAQELKLT